MPFVRDGTHPSRNFALFVTSCEGTIISVVLCMSPYRSDSIFSDAASESWRISLYGSPDVMTGLPRYCPRLRMFTDIARFSFYISRGNGSSKEGFHLTKATNYFHLRTIIVIAGVHQRLDSRLPPEGMTSPLDVLTLARHHFLYITLRFRRKLCFW